MPRGRGVVLMVSWLEGTGWVMMVWLVKLVMVAVFCAALNFAELTVRDFLSVEVYH